MQRILGVEQESVDETVPVEPFPVGAEYVVNHAESIGVAARKVWESRIWQGMWTRDPTRTCCFACRRETYSYS